MTVLGVKGPMVLVMPPGDEVTVRGAYRVTTAARTVVDLARAWPEVHAVAAVDAFVESVRHYVGACLVTLVTMEIASIPGTFNPDSVSRVIQGVITGIGFIGGGVILTDQKIVITQPTEGEFKAFTAVCTHQMCMVAGVDETINCTCHGSKFSITDGSVVTGPATKPLEELKVTVTGGRVSVRTSVTVRRSVTVCVTRAGTAASRSPCCQAWFARSMHSCR